MHPLEKEHHLPNHHGFRFYVNLPVILSFLALNLHIPPLLWGGCGAKSTYLSRNPYTYISIAYPGSASRKKTTLPLSLSSSESFTYRSS